MVVGAGHLPENTTELDTLCVCSNFRTPRRASRYVSGCSIYSMISSTGTDAFAVDIVTELLESVQITIGHLRVTKVLRLSLRECNPNHIGCAQMGIRLRILSAVRL